MDGARAGGSAGLEAAAAARVAGDSAGASPLPSASPRELLEESEDDFEYEEIEVGRCVGVHSFMWVGRRAIVVNCGGCVAPCKAAAPGAGDACMPLQAEASSMFACAARAMRTTSARTWTQPCAACRRSQPQRQAGGGRNPGPGTCGPAACACSMQSRRPLHPMPSGSKHEHAHACTGGPDQRRGRAIHGVAAARHCCAAAGGH